MADEAPSSEIVDPSGKQDLQSQSSVEGKIESNGQGRGAESSCNNGNSAENQAHTSDAELEKSLEFAEVLMDRGSKAQKDGDYAEATDCFSRALEIRVAHFGELAPECVKTYYKYGCALLYKAQDEADPLVSVPNEGESQQASQKDGSTKSAMNGDSFVASVSSNAEEDGSSNQQEKVPNDDGSTQNQLERDEESDAEDLPDGDDDESDLDLAWKMLDIARAIAEKQSGNTMEKVDILSALAEVALEREDVETSLSDYLKALAILEHIVEPDSRLIAELNFRICLCLEIGSKPQEAIPYCQKAISVCKYRVQRLMDGVKGSSGSTATSAAPESDQGFQHSSSATQSVDSVAAKEAEIETLNGLSVELEKKLEDLQQLVSHPTSILSDILGMVSAKAKSMEKSAASTPMSSSRIGTASSGGIESPTVSTAHTNGAGGVTHLGVVGRGVKRVIMNSSTSNSSPNKKPALEPSPDTDGNAP